MTQRHVIAHGRPIGAIERLFHCKLIVFTLGLWWPFYWLRQKARAER